MKKLLALLVLFTLLSAAAFAQFTVSVDADIWPELVTAKVPLGDNADKDKASYAGTGTFGLFSEWGTWYDNSLRLTLSYSDPDKNYSGKVRFAGNGLIRPAGVDGLSSGNKVGIFRGNTISITALDLFNQTVDQFAVTGKLGVFSAYFGNEMKWGKVNRFASGFSNFLDKSKNDNYGLVRPSVSENTTTNNWEYSLFTAYDVNNLRRSTTNGATNFVAGTVDLNPIYIDVASVVSSIPANGTSPSWSRENATIRVSGAGIADLLTFDAIYKISGGDKDTDKNEGVKGTGPEPDGNGLWNNQFGVYASLNIPGVDGLGLGLGYSGYFQAKENGKNSSDEILKYSYPLYSGVDLRVSFTGVENLTVTLNNNASFAGAKGTDSTTQTNYAVLDTYGPTSALNPLGKDEKDSYFALYNALLVAYKFPGTVLTARAEVANRLGSYTLSGPSYEKKLGSDFLQFALAGNFKLNSHVEFDAGLALGIANATTTETGSPDTSGGTLTFGIPLRMHIVF
jgi:hypothetical protein